MSRINYAIFYHVYTHPLGKLVRFLIFLLLVVLSFHDIKLGMLPKGQVFFLSWFFIGEVLFTYKVTRIQPLQKIGENTGDIYTSFTLQALDICLFSHNSTAMMKRLVKKPSIKFMLEKSHITVSQLPQIEIPKEEIAKKAYELCGKCQGMYVTEMDLFAAAILLAEPQVKLLFQKQLKEEEFLHILYWARVDFPQEEQTQPIRVKYMGEGFFDSFTVGWSLETKKYTTDITYRLLDDKPVLIGREKEFKQMVDILLRASKNSALIVGDTGVGKSSLVDELAMHSFSGDLPGNLYHKHVYELMTGMLVAGVKEMGDLEARLEAILQELSVAGNVILYLADLENILGSSTFHVDLSGALLPYLKGHHIPIVATITSAAYKNFVEPNPAFAEVFETVRVEELSKEETIQMMLEKVKDIEKDTGAEFTYKSIISAVDLSTRFMQDKALPGSAVDLLTSVAASAKQKIIDEEDVVAKLEEKTHVAVGAPKQEEKELLLHMEEALHKRIVGQEEAVKAISEAIRRVRAGLTVQTRPISFLFLGPTGVGKTETAKALASVYFGGEDKTIRLDMSEYTNEGALNRLLGSDPGQGNEKGELTEKVYEHPFSLVLLDEFEKAHTEVLDLFLQVLEDGRLTDNHGKRVNFSNTIIIATSNAGALWMQQQFAAGRQLDSIFQKELIQEVENEHLFRPELLNRFDGVIVFRPLSQEEIQQIARFELAKIQKKLIEQDITITFDDALVATIAKEGFDPQFGARPLRRFIQDNIEDALAKEMLEGKIARGAAISVSIGENSAIQFSTPKPISAPSV